MKSNRIILILIFFVIGYFLYSKDKPNSLTKLWDNIIHVFNSDKSPSSDDNPYKSPEPTQSEANTDTIATATNKRKQETTEEDKEESLFDQLKDKILSKSDSKKNEDGYRIPDFLLPAIHRNDEIIRHKNYTLRYEEKHEQPAWVAYKLRGKYTKGKANRSQNQFLPDRKVKRGSALSSDYSGSGYDRGHLVPAGDFKCCQELMNETFYMSNICPQVADFNRGIWENIESRIRGWAVRDEELFIVTGPVLSKGMKTIGRYNKVSVPSHFYKIVLRYNPDNPSKARAIAFLLPNQALFGKRMNNFVVSVDEVEKVTGIDFFANLPDELEDALEAKSDWTAWTKIQ